MNKTSTTEKLILYLYNETGLTESVLTQNKIDTDPEVETEFDNIKRAFRYVDKALMNPSPKCLSNILEYSARTSLKVNA
ncbi:MAG: hypothetical protein IPP71_17155 [Bacteroidetes bacterium]|nr:hypothetical protein [Bacteroidota bacterium]